MKNFKKQVKSMNYERIYHNIINNRLENPVLNEYTECHHILPKSLGGSNDKSNLGLFFVPDNLTLAFSS